MNLVTISGSIIDLSVQRFQNVSDVEQLSELGIFGHLPDEAREAAEEELFEKLDAYKIANPATPTAEEPVTGPSKTILSVGTGNVAKADTGADLGASLDLNKGAAPSVSSSKPSVDVKK